MMVMMIRIFKRLLFLFLLLVLGAPGSLFAQQKDFQTWFEAEVGWKPAKRLDLSGEFEQRFYNNSTRYDRTQLTLAASYEALEYLDVGGGFRFLTAADNDGLLHPRYRLHADAKGKYSRWGVDFSLRFRMQYGFEEFFYFTSFSANAFVNRYRLKAAYHIYGTRFTVFAILEPWGLVNNYDGRYFKKMRYVAGGSYRLNYQSKVAFRYIIEDEFNRVDPLQSNIFVFSYFYDL